MARGTVHAISCLNMELLPEASELAPGRLQEMHLCTFDCNPLQEKQHRGDADRVASQAGVNVCLRKLLKTQFYDGSCKQLVNLWYAGADCMQTHKQPQCALVTETS